MPVIEGRLPSTGQLARITTEGSRIARIEYLSSTDASLPWLTPGLVDLQVNGYAGHDVNGEHATPASIVSITHALAARGITTWVPTVITGDEVTICNALQAISDARTDPRIAAAIPFAHVEGPFLSPEDGPRGAHEVAQIRPLDAGEVERWMRYGPIGIVTVSPHTADAARHVERIVSLGIRVAIGHTHASSEQIIAAVDAGATLSTHLGNGIYPELPRHPNQIWNQLAEDRLTCGFIGDGHHLPADTLTAMLRAKGSDRSFLVSDSVALAGSPAGIYETPVGGQVELTSDGRLTLFGTELLAGSGVDLADVVQFTLTHTPASLAQVLEMASTTPARIAEIPAGKLRVGGPADLILIDSDGRILQAWQQGESS